MDGVVRGRARRLIIKRRALILLACLASVVVIGLGGLQLSRSRTYQLFGQIVPRVGTTQRVVALTFDHGPTPKALETLIPVRGYRFVTVSELIELSDR